MSSQDPNSPLGSNPPPLFVPPAPLVGTAAGLPDPFEFGMDDSQARLAFTTQMDAWLATKPDLKEVAVKCAEAHDKKTDSAYLKIGKWIEVHASGIEMKLHTFVKDETTEIFTTALKIAKLRNWTTIEVGKLPEKHQEKFIKMAAEQGFRITIKGEDKTPKSAKTNTPPPPPNDTQANAASLSIQRTSPADDTAGPTGVASLSVRKN